GSVEEAALGRRGSGLVQSRRFGGDHQGHLVRRRYRKQQSEGSRSVEARRCKTSAGFFDRGSCPRSRNVEGSINGVTKERGNVKRWTVHPTIMRLSLFLFPLMATAQSVPTPTIASAGYTKPTPLVIAPGELTTIFIPALGSTVKTAVKAP